MRLGIPGIKVEDVVPAAGLGLVPFRIRNSIRAESVRPASPGVKAESIIDSVARLVPQNTHTLAFTGAFHFQHLRSFQLHQAGMSQIKRNGESRDAVRRKPLFTEPDVRPKMQ